MGWETLAEIDSSRQHGKLNAKRAVRTEVISGIVVMCGIILLVRNGSLAIPASLTSLFGGSHATAAALQIALLLNIALILFGWRRYRDLAREVKERIRAENAAIELASSDPLTGLHNRRALAEQGSRMLQTAREQNRVVAVLLFDLDHFKSVNDRHGHAVGDALLRQVADEMRRLLPTSALLARLGGDEFACAVVFDRDDKISADRIAYAIVDRLSDQFEISDIMAHISVSVGIASSVDQDCTFDTLLRHADIAMYVAKRAGRNRASWFEPAMETQLRRRAVMEEEIRAGITGEQFVPYFEKQIDMVTEELLGFEVLARWNHPEKGLLSPADFIPIAEETGLISDLSLSVIRKALIEACDWDPALSISVNIAPAQLRDPWFAHKVVRILVETGFPPNRLEVEITEAALYDNLEVAKSTINSLKNQGVRLALDDFGTGHSSIAHLRALPFDRIKIDRSFAMSINENSENAAVINAVNQLGDSLAITVSVKGVEDGAARSALSDIGCTKGQGWFYGKPTSLNATRTMLAQQNLLATGMAQGVADQQASPDAASVNYSRFGR